MKKNNPSPYRSFSFEKIEAPSKASKSEPKCTRTTSKTDLRAGGKK